MTAVIDDGAVRIGRHLRRAAGHRGGMGGTALPCRRDTASPGGTGQSPARRAAALDHHQTDQEADSAQTAPVAVTGTPGRKSLQAPAISSGSLSPTNRAGCAASGHEAKRAACLCRLS
jgi:hypothetical protein